MVIDSILHGSSQVLNILGGNASHRYSAILKQIDTILINKHFTLLRSHASITKHSNLVSNMIPSAFDLHILQMMPQQLPHLQYPACHLLEFLLPFSLINRIG